MATYEDWVNGPEKVELSKEHCHHILNSGPSVAFGPGFKGIILSAI